MVCPPLRNPSVRLRQLFPGIVAFFLRFFAKFSFFFENFFFQFFFEKFISFYFLEFLSDFGANTLKMSEICYTFQKNLKQRQ